MKSQFTHYVVNAIGPPCGHSTWPRARRRPTCAVLVGPSHAHGCMWALQAVLACIIGIQELRMADSFHFYSALHTAIRCLLLA